MSSKDGADTNPEAETFKNEANKHFKGEFSFIKLY